jgi:hypothetical protein
VRYALSPYIKQIRSVFKGLNKGFAINSHLPILRTPTGLSKQNTVFFVKYELILMTSTKTMFTKLTTGYRHYI